VQIQIRSDKNINVSENRAGDFEGIVKHALRHCSQHITRVEVHLSDVNGAKHVDNDKSCTMEARIEHRQPLAVTDNADTVAASISGAADKLARLVKSTIERAADKRPAAPSASPPEPDDSTL